MSVTKLTKHANGAFLCPQCGKELREREGGAVEIKNGRVDMSATLSKYICDSCGVYYQELLHSGFYDVYTLPDEWRVVPQQKKRKLLRTGDIEPMELHRDANGQCVCPRCGELMEFVEGQPVRIVNGKPDFENVKDHFRCPYCESVYRRIASTNYFQWSEK